jgi:hypothetical protein
LPLARYLSPFPGDERPGKDTKKRKKITQRKININEYLTAVQNESRGGDALLVSLEATIRS